MHLVYRFYIGISLLQSLSGKKLNNDVFDIGTLLSENTLKFNYSDDVSGWNYVEIQTDTIPKNIENYFRMMFTVGFSEGYICCNDLKSEYPNFVADNFGGPPSQQLVDFIQKNYEWMKNEAELKFSSSQYWLLTYTR